MSEAHTTSPEENGRGEQENVLAAFESLWARGVENPESFSIEGITVLSGNEVDANTRWVSFTSEASPTHYTRATLVRDTLSGEHSVNVQTQRPSFEDEGFLMVVKETTTHAFGASAQPMILASRVLGRPMDNKGIEVVGYLDVDAGQVEEDTALKRLHEQLMSIGRPPEHTPRPEYASPRGIAARIIGWFGLNHAA